MDPCNSISFVAKQLSAHSVEQYATPILFKAVFFWYKILGIPQSELNKHDLV
jgi:hypothetical protein